MLESKFLKLVAKRGGCCHHLGAVIFDEGVTHIDGELIVLHAFLEVCFNLSQELWVELVCCWVTFSHHVLGIFDRCSTVVVISRLLHLHTVSLHVAMEVCACIELLLLAKAWLFHHWVAHSSSSYKVIL